MWAEDGAAAWGQEGVVAMRARMMPKMIQTPIRAHIMDAEHACIHHEYGTIDGGVDLRLDRWIDGWVDRYR